MLTSTRRGIPHPNPLRGDVPDIPAHMQLLVDAIDVDVIYNQGTDAARLAAAHQASGGRYWWTTDTKVMWYDDGTTWYRVSASQIDFAQITSTADQSADAFASAIPGNSASYDGTRVEIQVWASAFLVQTAARDSIVLYKDGVQIDSFLPPNTAFSANGGGPMAPLDQSVFDTPSAGNHTYAVYIRGDGANHTKIFAGAGGAGVTPPAYMRVKRA